MSQKSSVMQLPQFVPKALTSDTAGNTNDRDPGESFKPRTLGMAARVADHSTRWNYSAYGPRQVALGT